MKRTEFVNGACFGYYDSTFEECCSCRGREQCRKATESSEADEVRRVRKDSSETVRELLEKWK